MTNYLIYVGVAMATIMLPGPAVLLTLNNAIQRGLPRTFAGIVGISLAVFCLAAISATSIGVLLASSLVIFSVVKILGALYLVYLGIKMLRSKNTISRQSTLQQASIRNCFFEGFLVSISNPKALIFFMSVFPQFINTKQDYVLQFVLLAGTFSLLVIVIHTTYTLFASIAKAKLLSEKGGAFLGKISGSVFICFGVGLAASSR